MPQRNVRNAVNAKASSPQGCRVTERFGARRTQNAIYGLWVGGCLTDANVLNARPSEGETTIRGSQPIPHMVIGAVPG
jgi:hypothetical protein